ncbi:MAG: recombinase family protein [Gomphosphaeria aponina SAG 52.96 = DSM 107014]|uniref:Recombinase family protein n=1 Tax=Gomphosphaeria aponina SAG 52.96 = DSM 107014 TaxID=1521640 RepID=A0A941JMG7_9CHRO|nr:recombinase family protein [Gomphosphaeria aponina SAG 52.96 = DSM 107014]
MDAFSVWITGPTRSGKTSCLVGKFKHWVREKLGKPRQSPDFTQAVLVFAANDDNRRVLADKLSTSIQGTYPLLSKTPLGFISDEVMLFWPLLFEGLRLKAQFPLRLRPETEQALATRLWHSHLLAEQTQLFGGESAFVRRLLDLLQLAGAAGIPPEDIPSILQQGFWAQEWENSLNWPEIGDLLLSWRGWCLARGLLTYGIIYELYWRYLLPNPTYQYHLTRRYRVVFADDVDDYPAIARNLFEFLLSQGVQAVFTYNPDGQVRLGLNADPHYLAGLAALCTVEELPNPGGGRANLSELVVQLVSDPTFMASLPSQVQLVETISRAELLRKTAEVIIQGVKTGQVHPNDIAIIAPGLDEIARYSLMAILSHQGIAVKPLNEQRPLVSESLIRALLTLLTLVYPGLGPLVEPDEVGEMLVVLSRRWVDGRFVSDIDPVRGGLLADYCYHFDGQQPYLLPPQSFSRWDRLGYRATSAYQGILDWIEETKALHKQGSFHPVMILERAIKRFMGDGLSYDKLAALRELMETADHFWQVNRRLRENESSFLSTTAIVEEFIQLLRRGTITANPRPLGYFHQHQDAVTLATIFQYRSLRGFHPWQFWLDTGSSLWDRGGAATLFAAPLFLQEWSGLAWLPENELEAGKLRLIRILKDLLGRVGERVYLCHSELGVNGSEQIGPLLTLIYAASTVA